MAETIIEILGKETINNRFFVGSHEFDHLKKKGSTLKKCSCLYENIEKKLKKGPVVVKVTDTEKLTEIAQTYLLVVINSYKNISKDINFELYGDKEKITHALRQYVKD